MNRRVGHMSIQREGGRREAMSTKDDGGNAKHKVRLHRTSPLDLIFGKQRLIQIAVDYNIC